ncbi:MAG TPA: DUF2252 domain-containing protein [Solirubrobacterales bacterium]|nr:DUF2252 domain-containing protein [Solirubrobacterales bacterium]
MASTQSINASMGESGGKLVRTSVPRKSHATWEAGSDRPDPVETLERQDAERVPDLVPIRHGRMLASPFTFYRGAAAIMAADLATTPRSGLEVQLCGDAHLSNFGVFMAPDRRLIFDINDFDETHRGPFEWDVKRLATSFAVAGRALGLKAGQRGSAVAAAAASYREAMRRLAGMRDMDVWYSRVDVQEIERYLGQLAEFRSRRKRWRKGVEKAEHKDSLRALSKLAVSDGEGLRIISDPPLIVPIAELAEKARGAFEEGAVEAELKALIDQYRRTLHPEVRHLVDRYRYVDAAHKVVGVGSVGTRCWIVLMLGRDESDPLFLQVKEAGSSVLAPFTGAGAYRHQGRRVVEGQRLMQAASDILLGWITVDAGLDGRRREFYVRQLWDGKGSAEIERMDADALRYYAELCGGTLALGHARSGDRIAIASYLGKGDAFDRAICRFAEAYADQNDRDYEAVSAAVESGRLEATRDI